MKRRDFNALMAASIGATFVAASPLVHAVPANVERKHRKQWAREHFRGFENIVCPSFAADLKNLDEAGVRLDIRKSIEHGFFSSLCSPAALSPAELGRFLQIAVDEAKGKISIATALHTSEEPRMLEQMQIAEDSGCQHVLLDFPREGTQDELFRFIARFAERTNMGIYLWMSPQHGFERFHPSGIPLELFDRAADLPNVVALKVASIDPAVFYELLQRYNSRMLIGTPLINIMPMAIQSYGMQWSGAWSVEALQSPEKRYATEFFTLMSARKSDAGMKLYWEHLAPGFAAMRKHLAPLAQGGAHPWEHFKSYQFAVGGNGGRLRADPEHPNVASVGESDLASVYDSLRKIGVPVSDLPIEAFAVGRVNWKRA